MAKAMNALVDSNVRRTPVQDAIFTFRARYSGRFSGRDRLRFFNHLAVPGNNSFVEIFNSADDEIRDLMVDTYFEELFEI